ncbi:SEC-C metal-binding domain-containing protein, partial [Rhodoferax sp.]|uniref:SEC-C metal-binding domain-containing protein n=1 Tax=Rhodoferax sp. TaxID=50421 RepID=UPI003BB7BBBA
MVGNEFTITAANAARARPVTIVVMKKNVLAFHAACPCDSGLTYGDCCGRWHAGLAQGLHAPTPEA